MGDVHVTIATNRQGGSKVRMLVVGAALVLTVVALAACGGSSKGTVTAEMQKQADLYQIDQLEQVWHKATSTHDVDLMMTLWAPDATFTFSGKTAVGKAAVRKIMEKAGPFQPQNDWVSETPAYKMRSTVNGNKGTLYFECHYVDVKTGTLMIVVGNDQNVQKIDGKWLITSGVAATPAFRP
jgi:hypothetical protein